MASKTAKPAELQVIAWFLEAGWEVFTPVVDLNGTDLVVREPDTRALLALQVKHKEREAKNEGRLANDWAGVQPPFDYLVFYVPAKQRGVIVPARKLRKEGKVFLFFKNDADGYPTGPVRRLFAPFQFELSAVAADRRWDAFVSRFSEIHRLSL